MRLVAGSVGVLSVVFVCVLVVWVVGVFGDG